MTRWRAKRAACSKRSPSPTAAIDERLPLARALERVVEVFERRYVEAVLAEHDGNVSHAAEASGIARRYFQILKARMSKP